MPSIKIFVEYSKPFLRIRIVTYYTPGLKLTVKATNFVCVC